MAETSICVADCRAQLGEGPVWDPRDEALYWVDIKAPAIFRRGDRSGEIRRWIPPFAVASLAPRAGGGFVAGTARGFAFVDPANVVYDLIDNPEADRPGNRFNDGKLDRTGRFWAGTMDDAERAATGALYRLDPDLRVSRIDDGYRVTNGPAFDPNGTRMYHTDSAAQAIYVFDVADGAVTGKRVFALFGDGDGYPDGMTVDAEGCLWVAFWDGWCVRRLGPDGNVLETVPLPVQRPTSCTFGGPALDRLYVTSARIGLSENEIALQPFAGGVFMVKGDVGGIPDRPFG